MQNNKITPVDMVIKIAELLTVFQEKDQNEEVILETLQNLLELINILDEVEKTYYLNDIKKPIVIPSKNMPQSKALNECAQEIIDIWAKLKKEKQSIEFAPINELIEKSEKLSSTHFDNLDLSKTFITEAAGRNEECDLFIIQKKLDTELSDYEKEYIRKVSICAKKVNENVFAEESHSQNERILTQVLDNIDALIYVSDLKTGEILFVNDAMKKGFGLDDVKGKICWQVFQQGFTGTCDFCPVYKLKSIKDDPIIWEERNTVTGQYYRNTDRLINWIDGRIVHIQHSVDITELKNAMEEIKNFTSKQEERTKIMLDTTPLCVNFWDEGFNNIDCNEGAVRLFELQNKEEYLSRFFELSPEFQPCGRLSKDIALENITVAFNDGYKKFEWVHQKLNGEPVPSEITLVRVKQGDRNVVVGYTRDLREQKAMLAELKLNEDKLKSARDIAEKNAQAKSEFLSKMSHELRTPLNAIIGMISVIEKSNDIEKINGFIKKMKSASSNLLQTINDILDISKIDAGKMELTENSFNIDDMFRGIFDIIEYVAHDKDITIEMDMDTGKSWFIGDAKRLEQVYMNLLSNAVKFTGNGGKIVISVKYNDLENGLIEVVSSVKDNGVGIPEDKIDTLFENFIQVDNRLARQYSGTGLGLVIAKNIVELMGGHISVDSKLGEGSTFSLNFVLKEDTSQSKVEISPKVFNILVIDDSEETCEYLSDLFSIRKIKHKVAKSGEEGIKAIESEKESFNVILVDYMMPTMNGLDTVKKLRTIVDPDTIIIMISSMEWSIIEDDAKELGVNHFLPKPLLPSDIIDAINDIFKKKDVKHVESEQETFDFNGKTILLFEDVDINREIVQLLLENTGATCVEAEDGKVGVELYNTNPEKYDLILMDIQMPNMDGFEATKLIRESSKSNSKTIPIIAMTANVFANQIQDTLTAGMNSHLGKPVNEIELKRELKKWLDMPNNK